MARTPAQSWKAPRTYKKVTAETLSPEISSAAAAADLRYPDSDNDLATIIKGRADHLAAALNEAHTRGIAVTVHVSGPDMDTLCQVHVGLTKTVALL